MFFSDVDIKKAIKTGEIKIKPLKRILGITKNWLAHIAWSPVWEKVEIIKPKEIAQKKKKDDKK